MTDNSNTQTALEYVRSLFNAEWSPVAAIRRPAAAYFANLFRQRYPDKALVCGNRIDRAVDIMCRPGARQRGDEPYIFLVNSTSNSKGWYRVDLKNKTCTCPDHPTISAAGGACKHRLAVGIELYGHLWEMDDQAERVHKSVEFEKKVSRDKAIYAAHQQTERAWSAQLEAIDRWEYHVERFGDTDPRSQALREEVFALTRHAEALQAFENKL